MKDDHERSRLIARVIARGRAHLDEHKHPQGLGHYHCPCWKLADIVGQLAGTCIIHEKHLAQIPPYDKPYCMCATCEEGDTL